MTWLALLWLLAGCTTGLAEDSAETVRRPEATPTIHTYFESDAPRPRETNKANAEVTAVPTVALIFQEQLPPQRPKPTAYPTVPVPTPDVEYIQATEIPVFTDSLSEGWALRASSGVDVDSEADKYVYEGDVSIAMTPNEDFGTMMFAVEPEAEPIRRDELMGVSLWLNSGDDFLAMDEMSVTLIGSNEYTHWVPNDDSVIIDDNSFFSETRLYFLGLNRSIPAGEWVEVIVWLDNLPYDPDYTYLTGIYLKNDEDVRQTVYIDQVSLIILPDGAPLQPTETPVGEPTLEVVDEGEEAGAEDSAEVDPESTATPTPEVSSTPDPDETPEVTATPSSTPAAVGEACDPSPPLTWVRYNVQSGDTLFSLAVATNYTVERLAEVNCLGDDAVLSIGQGLWLPPEIEAEPEQLEQAAS